MGDIEQVLKVLSKAIVRETAAFNYYYGQSEDESFPPEVRGLLVKLAEEERVHRRLLMNEYISVEKGWNEDWDEEKGNVLTWDIPDEPPVVPLEVSGGLQMAAVSLPARLVGGDNIYTMVIKGQNQEERGTFFTLYDVMGHGLETTEINALANRLIGEYVESTVSAKMEWEMISPVKVVKHMNSTISAKYEGQGVFLTLLCALFDCSRGEMTYTLAGHEPPFHLKADGEVESLLKTQLIMGIDPGYPYREYSIPFCRGDRLCVFSDGIIEAKNGKGEMYGRERVASALEKSRGASPDEAIVGILAELREFCSGTPMEDELTIVIISSEGG